MRYLLDTNVISELRKPPSRAAPAVRAWAQRQTTGDLTISVITILEVEIGVARLERRDAAQGQVLRRWLEHELLTAFAGRALPVDIDVVRRAGAYRFRIHVPTATSSSRRRPCRAGLSSSPGTRPTSFPWASTS